MTKGAKIARPSPSQQFEAEIILPAHIEENSTATNFDDYVQWLPFALTPCELPQFHQLAVFLHDVMRLPSRVLVLGNDVPGAVEREALRVEELSGKSALFS